MKDNKDILFTICRNFIDDNDITCPESIYQVDKVIQNAYEFIEKICDEIGYARYEGDIK